ncbi:MAG: DUF2339 domain-containing protein [Tahibacter sp.]
MIWLLALIGLFAGAFVGGVMFNGDTGWLGAVFGAVAGLLAGIIQTQRRRLDDVERALRTLTNLAPQRATADAAQREASARDRAVPRAGAMPVQPSAEPTLASVVTADISQNILVEKANPAPRELPVNFVFDVPDLSAPALPPVGRAVFDASEPAPIPPRIPRPVVVAESPREPDLAGRAIDAVKRWFTEGNVPVKIGVLVLFLGVGALMKYAADQGWLRMPIELRLAGIAAVALAGLVFAWRKRESHRAFALSLQGGAIGVLILVVFGAYRLYHLIPATGTFVLLILLVAGVGVLAVAQDAIALAVLGIVGGFLAPIIASSNNGDHVSLFTYYAVLNAAIFGIAWIKSWRALNLIGFVFTFVVGAAWGSLSYRPELLSSTEPFLILYYAFYLLIPVLYALRQPEEKRGFVDGSLVFGLPLIAFPLQTALLDGDTQRLAISAMVLAAVHVGVAWFARRRLAFTVLGQSHALLALGFATLAVPLALSARATACAWAVEGAALVWLGLRQQRQLPRWIGYVLQLAAGVSLLSSGLAQPASEGVLAILNGDFLALALVCAAGFISARLLSRAEDPTPMTHLLFVWALLWWLLLGLHEIDRFALAGEHANWILGFVAFTTVLASELRLRLSWRDCQWPALAGFLAAPLLIAPMYFANQGPLGGFGALAWLVWFAAALRTQQNLLRSDAPLLSFVHFIHTWTWSMLLASQAYHWSGTQLELAVIWQVLLTFAPIAAAFAGTLTRLAVLRFPLDEDAETARGGLLMSLATVLGLVWLTGLFAEGAPTPLSYVPILNPLELAQLGFVFGLLMWFRRANAEGTARFEAPFRAQMLALIGFSLLTSITLRAVHFLGEVPWNDAMFHSALAQACLSVVWCLAGLAGMLIGARRSSRPIWIGGAALVGLVIAKLVLIDRSHLSDLSAILGVLAVGGLLMIVGWFAPNPPRVRTEASS